MDEWKYPEGGVDYERNVAIDIEVERLLGEKAGQHFLAFRTLTRSIIGTYPPSRFDAVPLLPGKGKSKHIKKLAKRRGIKVKNLKLKHLKPGDFSGLPFFSALAARKLKIKTK